MAEDHYCLTTVREEGDGRVALLGLESGDLCPITATEADLDGDFNSSVAWIDEALFTCDADERLIRISLRDGSTETAPVSCEAVTDYRGGLLVLSFVADFFQHPLRWYASFDDAQRGVVGAEYTLGEWSSRITTNGDTFYGAWHSTDRIDVGDLSTDRPLGVLALEDYDDWIFGMSVTNDGLLAVSGPFRASYPSGAVVIFDANTGRRIREIHLAEEVVGLSCVSPGAPTPPPVRSPVPTVTPPPTPTACGDDCGPEDGGGYCYELAESLPRLGRVADFPPSVSIAMNCGGEGRSSNYVIPDAASDAAEELHVIGVYEGGFREHDQGRVEVIVHPRPKPVALFLSSYEPVLWEIILEPGAQLSRVITQGYYAQAVEGVPEGVPVHRSSPEQTCGYAYGWEVAYNSSGDDYPLMIATARDLTGLTETTFQGCYKGDRFEIPYWSGEPPTTRPTPVPGDETIPREEVSFPGCEAVMAEQHYCLTTSYPGKIGLLGLDTGQFCEVATTTAGVDSPSVSSIGWLGELMYACTAGLVRISLRDGSWEAAQVPCDAVSDYRGGLLVSSWLRALFNLRYWGTGTLHAYPDYAAVLSGEPSDTYWFGLDSTRFTVHGDTFYGAWHAADTINVADLVTGETRDPIQLEGYHGWILGMSVTDDGQLVISGDTWGDTVRIFDAASGRFLRELHPTTPVFGLSCVAGKANPPTPGAAAPASGSATPTAGSATGTPRSAAPTPTPTATSIPGPASTAEPGVCGNGSLDMSAGEECDDGNNFGGDGCAANCTVESRRRAMLDPTRSIATVQQAVLPLATSLSGIQTLVTGAPRDTEVRDPQGNVITRPGEIPVVIKAADVQLDPVRVPGLLCACVRAVESPSCGAGNSASGIIGCGPAGLTDINYKVVQDHNTTPGDPANGDGSEQLPDDPECDDAFAFPGCGGVSRACAEGAGERCSAEEDFHRPPNHPSPVCNSPQRISFSGGPAGPGSALIYGRMAIGFLRDGGLCLQGSAAQKPDGSCRIPDYGPDCEPCTDDDADLGFPASVVLTTGKAEAAVFDANDRPDVTIDDGGFGGYCTSSSECLPGEMCGRTCLESGLGCASDSDCGPGDSCDERRCQVLCGGSRCLTTATGARFDCGALAANPADGLSGGALAAAFPLVDTKTIGDAVTTLRLAYE